MSHFLAASFLFLVFICSQPFQVIGTGRYGGTSNLTPSSSPSPVAVKPTPHSSSASSSAAAAGNHTDLKTVINIIKKFQNEKTKQNSSVQHKKTQITIETKTDQATTSTKPKLQMALTTEEPSTPDIAVLLPTTTGKPHLPVSLCHLPTLPSSVNNFTLPSTQFPQHRHPLRVCAGLHWRKTNSQLWRQHIATLVSTNKCSSAKRSLPSRYVCRVACRNQTFPGEVIGNISNKVFKLTFPFLFQTLS